MLFGLLISNAIYGQVGNSSISGVVVDSGGLLVQGASVTLLQPATGYSHTISTDMQGTYKFLSLNPGTYDLRVTKPGFSSFLANGFVLQVSQDAVQNVTLQVSSTSQEIVVHANASLVDTESAVTGQVVGSAQIVAFPLNGRDFLQLASLSSGANPTVSQGSPASFAAASTNRPNTTVNISGNRESSTSYLLDGVEMRDDRSGALVFQPSLDALEEFKVEKSFFQAENGFHPGIVNVATKSGTNKYHVTAYEFVRNTAFDATNYFAKSPDPFHQNQFGITVSGPIVKDKLQFLFAYEGLRQTLGLTASGTFPDQKQLSGDFSESVNSTIYDPATPGGRLPFNGNIIPPNRINPVAQKMALKLFPVVTTAPTGTNLVANPIQNQRDTQFIGRLDTPNIKTLGRDTQVTFRMAYLDSDQYLSSLVPLGGVNRPIYARNILLQATTLTSPTSVNTVRLGYQRDYSPTLNDGANKENIAKEVGLLNTTSTPADYYATTLELAGFSGLGAPQAPNVNTLQNSYSLGDIFTLIKGKHTLKTGADIRYVRLLFDTGTFASGDLVFSGGFTSALDNGAPASGTGNAVADFLLGYPQGGTTAVGTTLSHFRYSQFGFFVQDDWKVTKDLMVQAGIRYEPSTYPAPEQENNYIFNQKKGTLLFPKLKEAPAGLLTQPHREFGPRLGLAYSPSFDRKSSVRAGAGIYFDMEQLNELQFQNFGTPFYTLQSFFQAGDSIQGVQQLGVNTFSSVPVPPIAPDFVPPAGSSFFSLDPESRTPTVYQWNLDYQHEIGSSSVIEVGFFGSRSLHLSKRYNLNTCSSTANFLCNSSLMPYPKLGYIFISSTKAYGFYDGLQSRFEHRFDHGFSLLSAYTWQKAIDTDSGASVGASTERSACLSCDKGVSNFNIHHRLSVSGVYDLPFGKGKAIGGNWPSLADNIVGGWEISTIGTFQSGPPNDVLASTNNTGENAPLTARANCVNSHYYAKGSLRENGLQWLNPSAFSDPPVGTFGNCGRDVINGPGLNNFDISASKTFTL